jgi:hypothetical protein
MQKKYIILFAVAMIAATAIFIHHQAKAKQDIKSHHEQEYTRILEAAQKSPRAGLSQMGQALNRYYEKNHAYPAKLEDLYPDYIPLQAFIADIEWGYRKQGDNFYLSKTVVMGNQTMVAAIDRSLAPQDTRDVMLAAKSNTDRPQKSSPQHTSSNAVSAKPASGLTKSAIPPADDRAGIDLQHDPGKLAPSASAARSETSPPSMKEPHIVGPEVVAVLEAKEEENSLCGKKDGYLVWRSDDGSIGFGNVQYPLQEQVTIYESGMWVKIKYRAAEAWGKPQSLAPAADPQSGLKHVATANRDGYLLWKDRKGHIGYSNVQYPEIEQVTQIWLNGSWFAYNK